jgi:hypothetical protein
MERLNLSESLGFNAVASSGKKWRVKVIESGWGSSGYYGAEMLAQFGPSVFTKGTKIYMNHPSLTEASDRPERDVHQLAGKLATDAFFNEADKSLYADVEFYSHYAPIIKEMAGDVGLSIHAMGIAYTGEAEGREGSIVESLVADPFTSVDVVTVAGAGGKFVSLLESYKSKGEATVVAESETENEDMSITKEEFDAAIADIKATFVEALTPLRESVVTLVESASAADEEVAEDVAAEETETVEDEAPALDPVEVAEKFNESGLPKIALVRVAEALKSETNTKTVDELVAEEKAYAEALSAAVAPTAEVVGTVQEAAKSASLSDEFEAITSRIAKK